MGVNEVQAKDIDASVNAYGDFGVRKVSPKHDQCMHLRTQELMESRGGTVNAHDSLLNIDEDDEGVDDVSPAPSYPTEYEHSQSVDEAVKTKASTCCHYMPSHVSIFDQMTERLLDGLCGISHDRTHRKRWALEVDFLELLGCTSAPSKDEVYWRKNLSLSDLNSAMPLPTRPHRKDIKRRDVALQRIRQEQKLPSACSGLIQMAVERRTRSLEEGLLFAYSKEEGDGYDSDPELRLPSSVRVHSSVVLEELNDDYSVLSIPTIVQETFNITWTLTYHAPRSSPVVCRAWMERGTLLANSNSMLEPNLMWRPAVSTNSIFETPPKSIRLLSICRIMKGERLDRSRYPFAQSARCFWIRTTDNNDYLFQASSEMERDTVMLRWKHCVARFASLAVLEDMTAILNEFVLPIDPWTDIVEP
jgi:hypothetical protein